MEVLENEQIEKASRTIDSFIKEIISVPLKLGRF
jgi:hypothetical protein